MMRYQRVSPDCLPLSNGRKQSLRTCKEDDADSNGRIPVYPPSSFDGKPLRARSGSGSASASPTPDHHPFSHFSVSSDPALSENQPAYAAVSKTQSHHEINGVCSGGGNVLLQWGHNKRSRGSRAESRAAGDEPSGHSRQVIKIQRRAAAAATAAMPPPGVSYTRGANLRPCTPVRDSTAPLLIRSVEERSGGQGRSEKRSPPSPPEKAHRTGASLPNGGCGADAPAVNPESRLPSSDQEAGGPAAAAAAEKLNLDQFEWPRIYISLSRKEKEDDFLAMKGTKLPQRPKKRAKNIDKTLQYCFPGMWLSDLSRGRYEVREKKCVKKKRRGLKGMESMDSDSE